VQVGDTLLAIGDRVLEGIPTDGLVKLLVGPQASIISLTLRRSSLRAPAPASAASAVPVRAPHGEIYRCALLRGTEEFFQQLDTLYHAEEVPGGAAPAGGGGGGRVGGGALGMRVPVPYSEAKRLAESHIHHAHWFQVHLHLTSYLFAAVTLHPIPYALLSTPYTLHPTPYTLHPQAGDTVRHRCILARARALGGHRSAVPLLTCNSPATSRWTLICGRVERRWGRAQASRGRPGE
jgi:hypothetical protein